MFALTGDRLAISTPACRNSLKSCPNLPEDLARSCGVPRDACTSSLADWLSPAAARFSWLCASWKVLLLGGNWRQGGGQEQHGELLGEGPAPSHASGCAGEHPARPVPAASPPRPPQPRAELTESDSSLLLASPTMRMAASTSRCPGRQFTQRFSACDTALATCRGRERRLSLDHPHQPAPIPQPPPGPGPTCTRRCWLSGSPGLATAFLASSMRLLALSMTSLAHSSMAPCACGSDVLAATPRAAWLSERSAWATSRAAMPAGGESGQSARARPLHGARPGHDGLYLCSSRCPGPPRPGGGRWLR